MSKQNRKSKRGKTQPKVFDELFEHVHIIAPKTICKHKEYFCDICGTSDEKDLIHTTQNGQGEVNNLIIKHKRKK